MSGTNGGSSGVGGAIANVLVIIVAVAAFLFVYRETNGFSFGEVDPTAEVSNATSRLSKYESAGQNVTLFRASALGQKSEGVPTTDGETSVKPPELTLNINTQDGKTTTSVDSSPETATSLERKTTEGGKVEFSCQYGIELNTARLSREKDTAFQEELGGYVLDTFCKPPESRPPPAYWPAGLEPEKEGCIPHADMPKGKNLCWRLVVAR